MTLQTGSCPQNTTKSLIQTYLGQCLWLAPREVAQRQPRPGGLGWSSVLIPNSAIQNDKGKCAPKAAILLAIQTSSLPGANHIFPDPDPDLGDSFTTTLLNYIAPARWECLLFPATFIACHALSTTFTSQVLPVVPWDSSNIAQ